MKYTTRTAAPVRKNIHICTPTTHNTQVRIIQRTNSTTSHSLNSPEKDTFIINVVILTIMSIIYDLNPLMQKRHYIKHKN
jgi:hypothetical protein